MTRTLFTSLLIPCSLFGLALWDGYSPEPETGDFAFKRYPLLSLGDEPKGVRKVHPGFKGIAGWISSVGAAVALFDQDGDGLNNDYCLVDPRFDSVTVAPVPTTGARFAPIELVWAEANAKPTSVAPMGCVPIDVDSDGLQDLIVYFWGRSPSLHLAADAYAPRPLLKEDEIWNTNAATVADFNGDGHLDLFFGNYFPDGMAVLGTDGAVHMQRSMSRARNAGRNRIFLGLGTISEDDTFFEDASAQLNYAERPGWTLASGAADFDGDGLPELYIANDFGPDHLLHNRSADGNLSFGRVVGERHLTDPRSRVLGRDSFKGMGVDFGDIDRDGHLDIFVSNIAEDYALMESHLLFRGTGEAAAFQQARAPFHEISGKTGVARSAWSWDARIADFNNDGIPELLQATGFLKGEINRWPELHEAAMGNDELLQFTAIWPEFRGEADLSGDKADAFFVAGQHGRYVDMAQVLGFKRGTISRGIALGDVDGDGDLDALIARQWMPSILLLNSARHNQPSVVFDLRQFNPNGSLRPAVGALIELRATGHSTRMIEVVAGGEGHSGKSAPEVHFGLGAFPDDAVLTAKITWRDSFGTHRLNLPVTPGRMSLILSAEFALNRSEAPQND